MAGCRRSWNGNCHGKGREESGRFLKKAAQKLFLCWAMGVDADNAHGSKGAEDYFLFTKSSLQDI
jgi:hypothetical protein